MIAKGISPTLLRFDHIVLYARDLELSLDFYSRLPGIRISKEKGRGIVRAGYEKINIHQWPSSLSPLAQNPVIGHQSFCFNATGYGWNLQKELQVKEINVFQDIGSSSSVACPVCNDFYIEDPDRNRIRIKGAYDIQGTELTGIFNLSLLVSDIEASLQFYQGIIGMVSRHWPNGAICQFGDCQLRLVGQSDLLAKGNGDFCLLTDAKIEDIIQQLPHNVLEPGLGVVPRTGAMGPIRSVYLRDPDGNLVEIAEPMDRAAYFAG